MTPSRPKPAPASPAGLLPSARDRDVPRAAHLRHRGGRLLHRRSSSGSDRLQLRAAGRERRAGAQADRTVSVGSLSASTDTGVRRTSDRGSSTVCFAGALVSFSGTIVTTRVTMPWTRQQPLREQQPARGAGHQPVSFSTFDGGLFRRAAHRADNAGVSRVAWLADAYPRAPPAGCWICQQRTVLRRRRPASQVLGTLRTPATKDWTAFHRREQTGHLQRKRASRSEGRRRPVSWRGRVWRYVTDIDFGELRGAVGFGVRYKSPVGPLRIDLGFKLHRDPIVPGVLEPLTALHISLGQAF